MNYKLIIRWVLIAVAAAGILLAGVLTMRHQRKSASPSRPATLHAPVPPPRPRVAPPAAKASEPVVSNAAAVPASPRVVKPAASAPAESAMLAEQKRELDSAVEALAESKARMMVVDIKDKLNDGDVDGAERQLTEVLWLRPDYPPALEVRAQLLEQRARAVAARQQWHALTNATNAALAAQAKGESEARRLDAGSPSVPASVPEPPPAPLSTSVPPAEINEPVSAVPGPSAPIGTVDGPGTE